MVYYRMQNTELTSWLDQTEKTLDDMNGLVPNICALSLSRPPLMPSRVATSNNACSMGHEKAASIDLTVDHGVSPSSILPPYAASSGMLPVHKLAAMSPKGKTTSPSSSFVEFGPDSAEKIARRMDRLVDTDNVFVRELLQISVRVGKVKNLFADIVGRITDTNFKYLTRYREKSKRMVQTLSRTALDEIVKGQFTVVNCPDGSTKLVNHFASLYRDLIAHLVQLKSKIGSYKLLANTQVSAETSAKAFESINASFAIVSLISDFGKMLLKFMPKDEQPGLTMEGLSSPLQSRDMRASQHRLLDELGLYSSNQVGGTAKKAGLISALDAEVVYNVNEEERQVVKVRNDLRRIRENAKSSTSVFSVVSKGAPVHKGFFVCVPDDLEKENSPCKKRRK